MLAFQSRLWLVLVKDTEQNHRSNHLQDNREYIEYNLGLRVGICF